MKQRRRKTKRTRYVCWNCGNVWVRGEPSPKRCPHGSGFHAYRIDRLGSDATITNPRKRSW